MEQQQVDGQEDDAFLEFDVHALKERFKQVNMEHVFLLVFFIFFAMGTSTYSTGHIDNEAPAFFYARDALWSTQMAYTLDERGFIDFRSPYEMDMQTDAVFHRPPMFPIIAVTLAHGIGIQIPNAGFHFMLFIAFFSALCFYLIIRKINVHIAMLSLPLSLFIFTSPFSTYATWGHWFSATNILFVFGGLLCFLFIKERRMWVVFGLLFGAGLLSHVRESVYFIYFFAVYFGFLFVTKHMDWRLMTKTVKGGMLGGLLALGFMPYILFRLKEGSGDLIHITFRKNANTPVLQNFGWIWIVLVVGLVCALMLIWSKKRSTVSHQAFRVGVLYGAIFLLFTYLSYFSDHFSKAGSQDRFYWPFVLALFFGLVLYRIITFISKRTAVQWGTIGFALAAILVTMGIFVMAVPGDMPPYIYMYPETWQSFQWIQENTLSNEWTVYLYGDNLNGDSLFWMAKRPFAWVDQQDFFNKMTNGTVTSHFKFGGSEAYRYEVKTGPFSYAYKENKPDPGKTLCDFDYVYMNYVSISQPLVQYATTIGNVLMEKHQFTPIFKNGLAVILKNNNVGGECIGE